MNRSLLNRNRFQIVSALGFSLAISFLSFRGIELGEYEDKAENETLVISQNWVGKTAVQVEEGVTKPWEMILKSANGYRELKSISDYGSVSIYLKLSEGVNKEHLLQTTRNLYLLNRHQFPSDIHFPKYRYESDRNTYFLLLQRVEGKEKSNFRDLEAKIKNNRYVVKFDFQKESETEILLDVHPMKLRENSFFSMSEILFSLRNHLFGIHLDTQRGIYFERDAPKQLDEWKNIPIQSKNQKRIPLHNIANLTVTNVQSNQSTRINGLSKESILIQTDGAFHLFLLENDVKRFLSIHSDWEIVFSNSEGTSEALIEFLVFYLLLDLFFLLYFGFYKKEYGFVFVSFVGFLFVGFSLCSISSLFSVPFGNSSFALLLFLKIYLPFFRNIRLLFTNKQTILFLVSSLIFLSLEWIPMVLLILFLELFFCIVVFGLVQDLFWIFLKPSYRSRLPNLTWPLISFERFFVQTKPNVLNLQLILSLFFFILTFAFSFVNVFQFVSLRSKQDTILSARLEFPTYLSKSEIKRITKQVEETILSRKWTQLLVVTEKNFRSDFYLKLTEFTNQESFQSLSTEMGYFHFLGEIDVSETNILRFTNLDPILLETSIHRILPWVRNQKRIQDVVLCFQPSVDGLRFQMDSSTRIPMRMGLDATIKETSLLLLPTIVGKMLWNDGLVDVKLQVLNSFTKDEFQRFPISIGNDTVVHTNGLRQYETIQNLSRIYHENREISMEILVKGKDIDWDSLEAGLRSLMRSDSTHYVERKQLNATSKQYSIIGFFVLLSFLVFRKNKILDYLTFVCSIFFVWSVQKHLFVTDYLQFALIVSVVTVFQRITFKKKRDTMFFLLPLLGGILFFYFYPWKGVNFFFETFFLFFFYVFTYRKMKTFLRKMKPIS